MQSVYAANGVRFRYPSDWEISEQRDDGQLSITVASPHTSFWTLTLLPGCPEPQDIVDAALDAFREEYEELDVYPSKAKLCEQPTVARDIDFVCLELLNAARLRAFRTDDFTALVLYQGTEKEFETAGPVLEKITRSLACENGAAAPEFEADETPG